MAGSVNKVILIGHLGRDPEIRTTQSGTKVSTLSLATSESWKDKGSGERRERTEWHRVVIFNEPLVNLAEQYLRKGAKIYLEGQLATRKWTDQAGTERTTTEIVLQAYRGELQMLDRRDGTAPPQAGSPDEYGTPKSSLAPPGGDGRGEGRGEGAYPDLDDEIPF